MENNYEKRSERRNLVLILILMEYALGDNQYYILWHIEDVLILILMEYALGEISQLVSALAGDAVLILILMEYALGVN